MHPWNEQEPCAWTSSEIWPFPAAFAQEMVWNLQHLHYISALEAAKAEWPLLPQGTHFSSVHAVAACSAAEECARKGKFAWTPLVTSGGAAGCGSTPCIYKGGGGKRRAAGMGAHGALLFCLGRWCGQAPHAGDGGLERPVRRRYRRRRTKTTGARAHMEDKSSSPPAPSASRSQDDGRVYCVSQQELRRAMQDLYAYARARRQEGGAHRLVCDDATGSQRLVRNEQREEREA